jgi:hypothetical protein
VRADLERGSGRQPQHQPEILELLKSYPGDLRTRALADSVVRATWGALGSLPGEEDRQTATAGWARTFWAANSAATGCLRADQAEAEEPDLEDNTVDTADAAGGAGEQAPDPAPGSVPDDGAHLRRVAMDLFSSYAEALETSSSQLYDREQQEVHSGLVGRAARDVITAPGAPDLWCMEHGAHITRMLAEVHIYLEWMALQDLSVYRAFQDYGAGKAKLYALIMDEVPPQDRLPGHEESVTKFKALSRNSDTVDHRVVDTRDSFAEGKSIRAMAEECGLFDLYQLTYQMTSGVIHSEWWSIQDHAMEHCLNVLHGGHLIPSLALNAGGNTEFALNWVKHLYTLIWRSLEILGTDEGTVTSAFSWLESEHAGEAPDNCAPAGAAASPGEPA